MASWFFATFCRAEKAPVLLLGNQVELLLEFMPLLATAAAVVLCLGFAFRLLLGRFSALRPEQRLPRQLVVLGLGMVGVVAIVLALPVAASTRNLLLTALGVLASAVVGFSSTTLIANAMAGLMLRATKVFRAGDFIRIGEQFGRVSERGLLHTEIQTEDRTLTTLPNLYVVTNPVTVIHSSGTLVSATLSLGYDIHHGTVEPLLIEAARKAELEEPFTRILELGNFAITYRISGFLTDTKKLLTARSNLCRMVLEVLHGAGVEIVSPTYMNQRRLDQSNRVIPAAPVQSVPKEEQGRPEDLMFDKAERAERIEYHLFRLESQIQALEERLEQTEGEERERLTEERNRYRKKVAALAKASAPTQTKPTT
jgi:small conductance mechanosensitive channel